MRALRGTAGSRLHFGLLSPVPLEGRQFGGCGVVVDRPGLEVEFFPSTAWRFEGPLAQRTESLVKRLLSVDAYATARPLRIRITRAAPEHSGLGTGTQLSCLVAQGILASNGLPLLSPRQLAEHAGRGRRSAIGLLGFWNPVFTVDCGQHLAAHRPSFGVCHWTLPPDWTFLLAIPRQQQGRHGAEEEATFNELLRPHPELTAAMSDLLLRSLMPALIVSDFAEFSRCLHSYNRLAGEFFLDIQGGHWSSPWISEAVSWFQRQGIAGTGQSSWGPTVFALTPTLSEAEQLRDLARQEPHFADCELEVARALKWRESAFVQIVD